MNPSRNLSEHPIIFHRVIPASVVRRFRSDVARQKKTKKTLHRMRKERNDE